MKTIFHPITHSRATGGLIALLVLAALLLTPVVASAQMISDDCARCHNEIYQQWKVSGHPFKLMEASKAQNRPIPLPEGYTWDEISYVIGGYKWKSRYMDENGYIITQGKGMEPGNTQYNMLVDEWADYNASTPNGEKPYNCGKCHTTNWVENPDPTDLSGNQGGLAGIHGTFDDGGIQCIACHTAELGSHPAGPTDTSADACGACHYRTAEPGQPNVIPAKGGYIRHHEQYNEHLASPHAAADCVMCHNPHKRGEFSIWEVGDEGHEDGADCSVCHPDQSASYAMTSMADYDVTCEDCHMPFASKSAAALGPNQGDVMTHIFYINTDDVDRNAMFNAEGTEVLLDSDGKAAVTLDFACQRCHETASLEELSKFAKDFHEDVGLMNVGLNPGLSGTWWGGPEKNGEGFVLEFAYAPGDVLYFFGSFYTYDANGDQVYLTFQPATQVPETGTTVDVIAYITIGGAWNDGLPEGTDPVPFGTGTFSFDTCESGNVAILPNQDFQGAGFTNMSYDLSRLLEAGVTCPTFDNTSGMTAAAE